MTYQSWYVDDWLEIALLDFKPNFSMSYKKFKDFLIKKINTVSMIPRRDQLNINARIMEIFFQ